MSVIHSPIGHLRDRLLLFGVKDKRKKKVKRNMAECVRIESRDIDPTLSQLRQ